jgi:hypothetical protein
MCAHMVSDISTYQKVSQVNITSQRVCLYHRIDLPPNESVLLSPEELLEANSPQN